jgi:hypothetical protein
LYLLLFNLSELLRLEVSAFQQQMMSHWLPNLL